MRNNDDADVLSLRKRSHQSRSLRDAEEGLEQSGSSSSSSSDSDDGTDAKKKKRKHKNDDTPAPKAPRSPTTKKTKSVRFSDPIRTTAPIFAPLPAYREFDEIQSTPALTMLLIIFAIIVVIGIFTLGIYNHAPQDDDDVHPMIRLAHSVTIQSTTVPSAAVASTTTNSAATDEQ